ncbi:MAG: ABC transporter permease [Geminicoccaceae bacterium]
MAATTPLEPVAAAVTGYRPRRGLAEFVRRNPTIAAGGAILAFMAAVALLAPWIAGNPITFEPIDRLRPPSAEFWFGTDNLGRDVYARTVYGARISLIVGLLVAAVTIALGLVIGLVAGFYRGLDGVVMRIMDGIMAIPGILLAIALVALTRASVEIVIAAIAIPEIPRVVRLVRSVVLTVREQPYVDAAIASGTRTARILFRHILPNTVAPLIVQATYIVASAVITEAALSFLGAGVPPEIPTWGNMIADARLFLQIAPWPIFFPGLCLAILVLAVNILGDGLRDRLDPRIARRM